jgi:hypothetical protein
MNDTRKRTVVATIQGWNLKAFFQEVMRPILSPGDEVVFLSSYGLDSVIYRWAWEMREWDVTMTQVPLEGEGRAWRIAQLDSFGYQAADEKGMGKAKCIILFSTILDSPHKDKVGALISRLSRDDTEVIGFDLEPGSLEKLGPGIRLSLLVDILCETSAYDLRNGEEKIWEAGGVSYPKGFRHLFDRLGLKAGDEVVFMPGYGVCHPFVFQIAWEIRESGADLYVLPAARVEDCRRIVDRPPIGMLAGERAMPTRARYIVPLTGLTVTFPYPDKVRDIIASISGEDKLILTENMWPGAFQKAGWDRARGIDHDFTVDTDIREMRVFRLA